VIRSNLLAALNIARYEVEDKLEMRVTTSYEKAISEGLIEPLQNGNAWNGW